MTNEQKLDEIYRIIKRQEARNIRNRWFSIIKWVIILGVTYFIATNPTFIVEKVMTIMRPIIIENIKSMVDQQKTQVYDTWTEKILPQNQ